MRRSFDANQENRSPDAACLRGIRSEVKSSPLGNSPLGLKAKNVNIERNDMSVSSPSKFTIRHILRGGDRRDLQKVQRSKVSKTMSPPFLPSIDSSQQSPLHLGRDSRGLTTLYKTKKEVRNCSTQTFNEDKKKTELLQKRVQDLSLEVEELTNSKAEQTSHMYEMARHFRSTKRRQLVSGCLRL